MTSISYPRWRRFRDGWHWQEGIGKELWPKERDLVDWLSGNLDRLGNVVGMQLEFAGREVRVGQHWLAEDDQSGHKFWVGGGRLDLDLRNEYGQRVIVEAQLGKTDHSHLGQLVSYACRADAQFAIWALASAGIDSDEPFTSDHLAALAELNQIYAGKRMFIAVHAVAETARFERWDFGDVPLMPYLRRIDPAIVYYATPNPLYDR
jgi:hypothetical protein